MRQAGILAAAGLYALEHHVARLADDHANARRLAAGLAGLPGLAVERPQSKSAFAELKSDRGVRPLGDGSWRGVLVTGLYRLLYYSSTVTARRVDRAVAAMAHYLND